MRTASSICRSPFCMFIAAAALVATAFATSGAEAAQVTFAQFQQKSVGNPFTFTNAGAASTFTATSVPVYFQYLVPNDYGGVNVNIPAKLTLSAKVASPAVSVPPLVSQPLNEVSISIIADVPVSGDSLLLKVDVDGSLLSTSALAGLSGGHIGVNAADTSSSFNFDYTSDFVQFDPSQARNYALSFSSLFFDLSVNGNGYLNSFVAAGTGTFAATVVPEPGTAGMILAGAGILAGYLRRRARALRA